MNKKPVVGICMPAQDTVDTNFCLSLFAMGVLTTSYNMHIMRQATFRKRSATHRARNWLVRQMVGLDEPRITHLMWFDSDHTFPSDTLLRLLSADKDIVGCLHRTREAPYHVVGSLLDQSPNIDIFNAGGLHRASVVGSGILLVKREVYEALEAPWYCETRDSTLAGTDRIDPDNCDGDISEDVYFCREATKAGFEIWCDLDLTYEIGHRGMQTVHFRNPPTLQSHS